MIKPPSSDICHTDLSAANWHLLKDAILAAAFGNNTSVLPAALAQHPVAELLQRYRQQPSQALLNKAASLLTGNQPDSWQLLMKS